MGVLRPADTMVPVAQRIIRVRYDGQLLRMHHTRRWESEAWWDAASKKMRCTACGPQVQPAAETAEVPSELTAVETRPV